MTQLIFKMVTAGLPIYASLKKMYVVLWFIYINNKDDLPQVAPPILIY